MKMNPKVTKECKGCILIADCKRDDNDICLGWNTNKQINRKGEECKYLKSKKDKYVPRKKIGEKE